MANSGYATIDDLRTYMNSHRDLPDGYNILGADPDTLQKYINQCSIEFDIYFDYRIYGNKENLLQQHIFPRDFDSVMIEKPDLYEYFNKNGIPQEVKDSVMEYTTLLFVHDALMGKTTRVISESGIKSKIGDLEVDKQTTQKMDIMVVHMMRRFTKVSR